MFSVCILNIKGCRFFYYDMENEYICIYIYMCFLYNIMVIFYVLIIIYMYLYIIFK